MLQPNLTFFCELEATPLIELFDQPGLLDCLKKLRATVSLGLLDFSSERMGAVQLLNSQDIPVTAWLLLPKEQGYWFHIDNAHFAARRVDAFLDWTAENQLCWKAVGLDIEPDIGALQLLASDRRAGLRHFWKNLADRASYTTGRAIYREIIKAIRAHDLAVESYQFPFIVDERRAGSTLLQRLSGVVNLAVDREVLMLYSSFYQNAGVALLKSYASEADGVGIGSTGGGVTIEGLVNTSALSWEAFQRDLLIAAHYNQHLYIFSLEGCQEQGFLARLVNFDWNVPPASNSGMQPGYVNSLRVLLRGGLRLSRLFFPSDPLAG